MGKEIWITNYFKINNPLTKQYQNRNFRIFFPQNYRGILSRQSFFNSNRWTKQDLKK